MPAHRKLPDAQTLRHLRYDLELTDQQIADWVLENTGERVTRVAVTAAFLKMNEPERRARYETLIPWPVLADHRSAYPVRMLRLLGRRQTGKTLSERDKRRLDAWLGMLKEADRVVYYEPDSEEGFWYVPREKRDGDGVIRFPEPEAA